MNKKRLAIIGAVEGTENRLLEKDCLLAVTTIIKHNPSCDYDIHLLQPTCHDILSSTRSKLKDLGVYFHKFISEYNQPSREFNYTNMPIACGWFHEQLSQDYDYFLWLDSDVLCRSELILPEVCDDSLMFLYNNEFYSLTDREYITFISDDFAMDAVCYDDMVSRVGKHFGEYTATNSWVIYGKSTLPIWADWNSVTREYISSIESIGPSKFAFYEKSKAFENRVEEITLDIVIKEHQIKQVYPTGFHTYNSADMMCTEFLEMYNPDCHTVHYDMLKCVKTNKQLEKYLNTPYIKSLIYTTHGIDIYKEIFYNE